MGTHVESREEKIIGIILNLSYFITWVSIGIFLWDKIQPESLFSFVIFILIWGTLNKIATIPFAIIAVWIIASFNNKRN